MSQGGNSSSSTTPSASSTKPAQPPPFKVELNEIYSRLQKATNYSISDDLLTELKASRIASLELKTEQEGHDHSMDARLGKAIFIANLRELAGRLEPREDKGWLTTFCEAFSCTESMLAFIVFTGIKGLQVGDWYRGLGNHLDKSPDPVLALWKVLFPLLPHVRGRVDKHFKRRFVRDPIPPCPPPRRDYAALANIDPTAYSSNDIVELIIPTTKDSLPSSHPGMLIPKRLSTYEAQVSSQGNREFNRMQLKLVYEVRSGNYESVPPTTLKKVVMERTIFDSIAFEGDADIRLANIRLAIQLYKGKITIECFDKIELVAHSNLSFGTGYDANRFFVLSVPRGQRIKKVHEHWAGTQFEAVYKITRETAVDPESHAAWSENYFKPQLEFLVKHYYIIKAARSPSQTKHKHVSPPAPAPEPSDNKKRKRTSATDEKENQSSAPGSKRIRTIPSSTPMTRNGDEAEEGRKVKCLMRKEENVTINEASTSNVPSTSRPAAHYAFPTSSFQPDIPLTYPQGNRVSPSAYPALAFSHVAPYGEPRYVPPFMSYDGPPFGHRPFTLHPHSQLPTSHSLNYPYVPSVTWSDVEYVILCAIMDAIAYSSSFL